MFNKIKIGTKLLVISALLVAIPLVVVTAVAVTRAGNAVTSVGDSGLSHGAQYIASGLNHALQQEQVIVSQLAEKASIVTAMEAVANGSPQSAADIASATHVLKNVAKNDASFNHMVLGYMTMDRKGTVVVASSAGDLGLNFGSHSFFQRAMQGHDSFGTVVLGRGDAYAELPVAAPIFSANGKRIVGVLQEQLSLQYVQKLVADAKIGKSGFAFITDQRGISIASKIKAFVMKLDVLKTPGLHALGAAMIGGKTGVMRYMLRGQEKLAGFAPVAATGWSVGLTVPAAEYLAPVNAIRNFSSIVAGIAIVLTLLILVFFVRSITRPLAQSVGFAQSVAKGDFTRELSIRRGDEIGLLTGALNDMVGRLKEMIIQVRDASLHVASSSEEISAGAQELSAGAQNQASTLEETSASVEELTASVEQVSDHAQSQAASVEESSSNMRQMEGSVEQVSRTLAKVSSSSQESMGKAETGVEAVKKAVEAITNITKSSEQIAGIITVISDIADQTNLLALNASIEAARAGEHGRGFAVVADEVSKLAERSSSSTKEIEELIRESNREVKSGVEIAQAALSAMDEIIAGARGTDEMVTALSADIEQQIGAIRELSKATESISEMSQSISAATEEQTTNAKQVAKAIENVNELTQAAAGAAEEMSATTEELSTLAQQLQRVVELFKVNEESVNEALPPAQPHGHDHHSATHADGHSAAAPNGDVWPWHENAQTPDTSRNGDRTTAASEARDANGEQRKPELRRAVR